MFYFILLYVLRQVGESIRLYGRVGGRVGKCMGALFVYLVGKKIKVCVCYVRNMAVDNEKIRIGQLQNVFYVNI